MSSTYLTHDNMKMIERLLAEVYEPGRARNFDRKTAAARFLIQNFEENTTAETDLRALLATHVKAPDTVAGAVARWENEGGATALSHEAQRRVINDTVGTRRRARETEDRHRLV